ncbi:hypothetical protein VIGAN_11159300, partial [Vigna angularis var. angularis]
APPGLLRFAGSTNVRSVFARPALSKEITVQFTSTSSAPKREKASFYHQAFVRSVAFDIIHPPVFTVCECFNRVPQIRSK